MRGNNKGQAIKGSLSPLVLTVVLLLFVYFLSVYWVNDLFFPQTLHSVSFFWLYTLLLPFYSTFRFFLLLCILSAKCFFIPLFFLLTLLFLPTLRSISSPDSTMSVLPNDSSFSFWPLILHSVSFSCLYILFLPTNSKFSFCPHMYVLYLLLTLQSLSLCLLILQSCSISCTTFSLCQPSVHCLWIH